MSEVKEIKAYKVGNKLFENKENAERYKIECLDPCQIGDIVSTSGFRSIMDTFAPFGRPTILGSEGMEIFGKDEISSLIREILQNSTDNPGDGEDQICGRVSCIEDHGNKIYFVIGNCPEELIMSGAIKSGAKKYKYDGMEYSWGIGCLQRERIFRRPLPWCDIEIDSMKSVNRTIKRNKLK